MYFPLFLPLCGIRKGNKGNFCCIASIIGPVDQLWFKRCLLLYQEVLQKPVLLFLLSERKYSLWYWHQSALTVLVHLLEPPHWKAGCWCKCDVTGENGNLQILPASLPPICIQCWVYSAVPKSHLVAGRQRRFLCNLSGYRHQPGHPRARFLSGLWRAMRGDRKNLRT